MTNSEIKNCEHKQTIVVDNAVAEWCEDCGAFRVKSGNPWRWGNWYFPRTPEPTKAENGLVKLDIEKVADLYDEFYEGATEEGVFDVMKFSTLLCSRFGTPSITKEQLLAILPKLRNPILHDDPSDFRERNEQFTYSSSVESFNFAVLQIKQRIEELFK